MPNACRVTLSIDPKLGAICTVQQNADEPLNCILFNAPADIQIIRAGISDFATTNYKGITPAEDGRSFQIPLDTAGTFRVSALINTTMGHTVSITEDCASNTQLFWFFVPGDAEGPASDGLTLVVQS